MPVLEARAGDLDITLEENSGRTIRVTLTEGGSGYDLTGYSFSLEVKRTLKAATVLGSATITAVDLPNGVIDIEFTEATVNAIGSDAVYDLVGDPGAPERERLLSGSIIWLRAVTT